ncbi:MAG: DNA polymerase III subunit delta [Thermodesulfovibrionales bacterium]
MSIRQFQQELSQGLRSPIYLFHSPEDFLLYEAFASIREQQDKGDVFNFDVYDCKSSDDVAPMEQIVDTLNTLPFLAGRRTVVLKNLQKLAKKEAKKLEAYLAAPSPASLLIMLHEGASPKLFEAAALKGVKMIALTVQEKEIPLWITSHAKEKGLTLTGEAVDYLITVAGTDLGMLSAEIEKLSCWSASGSIGVEELKGTVYAGAEYSAFDLTDALAAGDAREVFRIAQGLLTSQEPQMVLGALNYQLSRQLSRETVPQPSRPLPQQKAPQNSSEENCTGACEVFKLLHEADAAVKTSHKFVLEDLLLKLLRRKGRSRPV